jgi:hypothetical protein
MVALPLLVFSADQQKVQGGARPTEKDIAALRETIEKVKTDNANQISSLQQTIQTTFSGVTTSLNAVNHFLSIVAIVMALFAVGLGTYIAIMTRRMSNSYKQAQDLLNKSESVKTEIDRVNRMIKSNWSKLYSEIKEEETKYIIARLKEEPRDIVNFSTILMCRNLSNEYYADLKASFQSLTLNFTENQFRLPYIVIFFQHYAGLSLFDAQLGDILRESYYVYFQNAFKKDILGSVRDLVKASVERGFRQAGNEVIRFLSALQIIPRPPELATSFEDVLSIVWEGLTSKENRFAFYQMLPDEERFRLFKIIHGRKLIEKYGTPGNTESENLIMTEIRELLNNPQGMT